MENKQTKSRIGKTILYNERSSKEITIPDYKLYYRATVVKTVWKWYKNRQVDQGDWNEDPDINPHTYEHLIFDNEANVIQWKRENIFKKWCWHVEESK